MLLEFEFTATLVGHFVSPWMLKCSSGWKRELSTNFLDNLSSIYSSTSSPSPLVNFHHLPMRDNVINKTKSNGILVAVSGKRQTSVQHDFPCKVYIVNCPISMCIVSRSAHYFKESLRSVFILNIWWLEFSSSWPDWRAPPCWWPTPPGPSPPPPSSPGQTTCHQVLWCYVFKLCDWQHLACRLDVGHWVIPCLYSAAGSSGFVAFFKSSPSPPLILWAPVESESAFTDNADQYYCFCDHL